MTSRLICSLITIAMLIGIASSSLGAEPTTASLRETVILSNSSNSAAKAYKAFFLHLGRAKLQDLMKDDHTGIALQAAWETRLKPIKRKPAIEYLSDDIYDPIELAKFVAFLKERTKVPVPKWWETAITTVDLFPGRHHYFDTRGIYQEKVKDPKTYRGELAVEAKGDKLLCTSGKRSIEIPKDTFDSSLSDFFVGWLGEKQAAVATYHQAAAISYKLHGFKGKGGEPLWKAEVWAADRHFIGGSGFHPVEMVEKEGIIYLFGMESHGAYLEAFDLATGKVQFRFCTCYWFNFSEEWGLK